MNTMVGMAPIWGHFIFYFLNKQASFPIFVGKYTEITQCYLKFFTITRDYCHYLKQAIQYLDFNV